MPETLIQPPRTILEVWESLPESTLCELINDKIVMRPSPFDVHQKILVEISVEISLFLRKNAIGNIIVGLYDVHFSKQNILQPDIIFIKNENLHKIKENGLHGAPDIVIEVLSPSTSHFDFDDKKSIYERFGVQEYFIVEPNSKSVISFNLVDGEYEEQESSNSKFRSALLNTEIMF